MRYSHYGFFRMALANPIVTPGDFINNLKNIKDAIEQACHKKSSLISFPELCITGASCGDMFKLNFFLKQSDEAVRQIVDFSKDKAITIIIGAPLSYRSNVYNCAFVIREGKIIGAVPKISTSFNGRKHNAFQSGSYIPENAFPFKVGTNLLFKIGEAKIGIEVGSDIQTSAPNSLLAAANGADVIINPMARIEDATSSIYFKKTLSALSALGKCVFAQICARGESTSEGVYAGNMYLSNDGDLISYETLSSPGVNDDNFNYTIEKELIIQDVDLEKIQNEKSCNTSEVEFDVLNAGKAAHTDFAKDLYCKINPAPFSPKDSEKDEYMRNIITIQAKGIIGRLKHIHCEKVVLGISGGLDSTMALLAATYAFDLAGISRKNIIGITMPGFGTSSRTKNNADALMEHLGITTLEISISDAVKQHFKDIKHNPEEKNVVFENAQARERTQILMDYANKIGGIVLGTGDLSEIALGWCTYNGDHMSMYSVNCGIPKTLMRELVAWAAHNIFIKESDILIDIIDTPVSPELKPVDESGEIAQKTEDIIGPYELHDFFLYNIIKYGYSYEKMLFVAKHAFCNEYSDEEIEKWLKKFIWRFLTQQFKRSCSPDGPRTTEICLSPTSWCIPSDMSTDSYLNDLAFKPIFNK